MPRNIGEWTNHLDSCQICRKAIRGRFAGASGEMMSRRCCEVGKPLYIAFLKYNGSSDMAMKLVPIAIGNWEKETQPYEDRAFKASSAARYLCKKGLKVFVSTLRLHEHSNDDSLPKNCDKGCVYVDPRTDSVIPVDDLDELYYIEGGDL